MTQRIIRIASILCFIGLVPLAALSMLRILHLEHVRTVVVFETVMFYFFLPVYVILFFAVIARQKALAVFAGVLVTLHIFWWWPEMFGSRHLPHNVASAHHFSLYSQNVEFDNQSPRNVGLQIRNANTDFVLLEELSVPDYAAMKSVGAFDQYKYSYVRPSYSVEGMGIFSKYPLTSSELVDSPGFPQMRAVANINGEPLVLWNVHMRAPVDGPLHNWFGDFSQLKSRIDAENQPTLVAGDFNATWGHRPFRDLLNHGFHEAAVDLGKGYMRTWPVDGPTGKRLDGIIRLDHVLYNQKVRATSIRNVAGGGSDHRATVTQLALFQ